MEGTVNERALAGSCDPGDHGQHTQRNVDIDVLQIVGGRSANLQRPAPLPHLRLQPGPIVHMAAGECAAGPQLVERPLEDDLTAARTGPGTQVDDLVGDGDHLRLVLHHQDGISLVAQSEQQFVGALDVVRMQPHRRLIEHVGDIGQRRTQMADHLRPLRLSPG